jgi:hypothetical protein
MFHHISYAFCRPVQSKHHIPHVITVASAYTAKLPLLALVFDVNVSNASSLRECASM